MLIRELFAVDPLIDTDNVPAITGFDQFGVQTWLKTQYGTLEFIDGLAFSDLAKAAALMPGLARGVLSGGLGEPGMVIQKRGQQLPSDFFLAEAFGDVVGGSGQQDVADRHQGGAAEAAGVSVIETLTVLRSEERRVGKECRSRWARKGEKRK